MKKIDMSNTISGRLFMTIAISLTFCICSGVLLLSDLLPPESKMAVFVALSTLTGTIAKDYFTRTDRDNKKTPPTE